MVEESERAEELLREAFSLASMIPEPYPRFYVSSSFWKGQVSVESLIESLQDQPIDRLSTKCRIVRRLAEVIPEQAAVFAGLLSVPAIPELDCTSGWVPDPSVLYETLRLAGTGKASDVVARHLRGATSSVQLPGLVRLIQETEGAPEDFALLLSAFAEKLRTVADGDPGFTVAMIHLGLDRAIARLAETARDRGLNHAELVAAYRRYLVQNLSLPRCAATGELSYRLRNVPGLNWVAAFNRRLQDGGVFSGSEAKRIAPGEIVTESVAAAVKETELFSDPEANAIYQESTRIKFGGPAEDLLTSLASRRSAEWEMRMTRFLERLESWAAEDKDRSEVHFVEKCHLFQELVLLPQSRDLSIRAATGFAAFLGSSSIERENPSLWLGCLDGLLSFDREGRVAERDQNDPEPSEVPPGITDFGGLWSEAAIVEHLRQQIPFILQDSVNPELYLYGILASNTRSTEPRPAVTK
jgi:hypothetical protein